LPRISDLTSYTAPSNSDLLAIVDQAGAVTKKITRADLLKGTALPADTGTTPAIANGAVTPEKWTNPYTFNAYASSSTTVGTGWTKIVLASKAFDLNGDFSTGSSEYTTPVDGIYHFDGMIEVLAGASTEGLGVSIFKNGSLADRLRSQMHRSTAASQVQVAVISGSIQLLVGDKITLYGVSTVGGRGTTAAAYTQLSGHLITRT